MQFLLNICTLLTSLISLLTLHEMMRQRRASMMPNILTKSRYSIYLTASQELVVNDLKIKKEPFMWSNSDAVCNRDKFWIPQYNIQLINVGNGTATNIRYEWELDIEYYLAEISQKDKFKKVNILFDSKNKKLIYHTLESMIITQGLKNTENKISYLQSSQIIDIELCKEFILLYSTLYYFTWNNTEEIGDNHEEFLRKQQLFPYPKLIIKFCDISGKEYKKKFKTQIKSDMISYKKSHMFLEFIEE